MTQFLLDRHLRPRDAPAFSLPEGLTSHLMTYDRFAEERGWTPRQVDELTREELFWLPVIKAARAEAAGRMAALDAKD